MSGRTFSKVFTKASKRKSDKNDIIKVISSEQGARKDIGRRDFLLS